MIKLANVSKAFEGQKVLDRLNLEIPHGGITCIIGPSGMGKSVLLKHIIGLMRPDAGAIYVDGANICELSPEELVALRKKFGMLFQGAALFDSLSVFDNVAFPLVEHSKLSASEIKRKVLQKLELVGLENVERKMPHELSGGMKKRVGLARAIILEPKIILYDEPTTGLDPIMTESVDNLILNMQKKLGVTSVVISHDIQSIFRIADFVAMLSGGKIVAFGTPSEMRASKNPVVREFIGS